MHAFLFWIMVTEEKLEVIYFRMIEIFSVIWQILVNSEYLLKYAMDYSLGSSSRSPLDYIQHQIIWWICHDWAKVDNGKKATFVFSDKACPVFCCSLQLNTRDVNVLQRI
jgi:hypothetical protein